MPENQISMAHNQEKTREQKKLVLNCPGYPSLFKPIPNGTSILQPNDGKHKIRGLREAGCRIKLHMLHGTDLRLDSPSDSRHQSLSGDKAQDEFRIMPMGINAASIGLTGHDSSAFLWGEQKRKDRLAGINCPPLEHYHDKYHDVMKMIQGQLQILDEDANTACGFGRFSAWLWGDGESIIVQEFHQMLLSASVATKQSAALYRGKIKKDIRWTSVEELACMSISYCNAGEI
ncbi:hypothetical protein BS47DRAFT_1364358 [Hydnum rufescens UP504]|uniref:Uncharacterized protein n=1 Tax=Hydnum rufescens UP504 TaxID=1448309 RepID=A0A9P6ARK6_9AGAM|nr:hypothetical protein BS47DRAFT_1364358 [Hydnum rufescens UP504]